MDKLARYRQLLEQVLSQLASLCNGHTRSDIETLCAFDEERDQYLVSSVGWIRNKRIVGITVYARLRNGKIWIEEDMTEDGITDDLVKAGVPKEDIVLAFHHPDMRPLTEYAVA